MSNTPSPPFRPGSAAASPAGSCRSTTSAWVRSTSGGPGSSFRRRLPDPADADPVELARRRLPRRQRVRGHADDARDDARLLRLRARRRRPRDVARPADDRRDGDREARARVDVVVALRLRRGDGRPLRVCRGRLLGGGVGRVPACGADAGRARRRPLADRVAPARALRPLLGREPRRHGSPPGEGDDVGQPADVRVVGARVGLRLARARADRGSGSRAAPPAPVPRLVRLLPLRGTTP